VKATKIVKIVNWIIALVTLGFTSYIIYEVIVNPLAGMRALAYTLVFPAAVIGFNRLFAIWQKSIKSKRGRRWFGLLKWVATFLLPLLLIGFTEDVVCYRSTEIVKQELSPLISYIADFQEAHKNPPNEILEELKTVKTINNLAYYKGEHYYLLSTVVGSIDMDGYTIFYYSSEDTWFKFHNDDSEKYNAGVKIYNSATKNVSCLEFRRNNEKWNSLSK